MPRLTIGFSPCPNDTFMFGALVNGQIDTGDVTVEPVIEDVESLNRRAMKGELDVSKLSISAYAFAADRYFILNSGSALGRNCGPLIVSRQPLKSTDLAGIRLVIPGKYTTANLLTGLFFPKAQDKTEAVFSAIEDAVLRGDFDAGVIIHESRFTYAQKGLMAFADLGRLWEAKTNQPLPLGCMAARRSLPVALARQADGLLRQSIRFAMNHPAAVMPFIRAHAAETDETVMQQHIALYVNEFSITLTAEAKKSIRLLLDSGSRSGLLPAPGISPFPDEPNT